MAFFLIAISYKINVFHINLISLFPIYSLPLVKQSDGVVLVVKHNSTTYPALKKVIDVLNRNGGKILGIIVNNVESVKTKKFGKGGKGYGYEYGYGYGYY